MNPTQLKRVIAVLVVLLVFWGAAEILGGGGDEVETALVLPAVQRGDVDSVSFTKPSGTAVLVRSGDEWSVNGFAASSEEIDRLFEALTDSSEADLVSTSALVHGRMGVDSAAGIEFAMLRGGERLASVVFGKRGRQYNTRYVRTKGSEYVYLYKGGLTGLVDRSVDDWRDKRIFDVEPDSVDRVAVELGTRLYSLMRREDRWQFGTGAPADSAAVRRMLEQYKGLEANSFASEAQADSADLERPDRRVTLFNAGGDTLAALVFDSTNAAFWVQKASGGIIYRLLQWKVNQMVPADSTLRP